MGRPGPGCAASEPIHPPYLIPAGTPIWSSVARRFGAIFRSLTPVNSFAKVEYISARSVPPNPNQPIDYATQGEVDFTAMIPFNIN